ncbi:hypothetical protein Sgly_1463 [Syntrophobotulus glycolicus DSM 8271]|uniref:Uncharacterized protein n=2 Tax=Syntrophobotulus TaxID=51196 RepID=F0SWY1_SYNGF|nr:hypothetical protein Sgly_1463 [Syntrophobotulus glycolicus DSM 8271]
MLFLISNILYETCLYLCVYAFYINYNKLPLFFLVLFMFACMIVSGFPNSYYRMGYKLNIRRIDMDAIFKLAQLFLIFVGMSYIGTEKIFITICLLLIIMMINLVNRIEIYRAIKKEQITFYALINKMNNQSDRDTEKGKLLGLAWKLLIPLIGFSFFEESILIVKLAAWVLIGMIEGMILNKLYQRLIVLNPDIKKEFLRTLIKSIVFFSLLIIISILSPRNLISYVFMALCTTQFVDLIHRQ